MSKGALVGNCADAEQVKEADRRATDKRAQELADMKAVMGTPAGRRLMWRIVNELCHFDTLSAVHSGSFTYLNEGERNIGRLLKADAYEAAFKEWQLMEKEYMDKKLKEEKA